MSVHDSYHAAVYQPLNNDRQNSPSNNQAASSQYRPPVAATPTGYQQTGSSYAPDLQQGQYSSTLPSDNQARGVPIHGQSNFPPQGQPGDEQIGGITSQLGSMGVGGDANAGTRPNKKKNRHAYHNLDQPSSTPQNFNGPLHGQADHGQFLNSDSSRRQSSHHPYAGQQVTPAMNQFPAQNSGQFSPGVQAVSPGFGGQASSFGSPNPAMPTPSGPGVSAQGRVDPEQIPSVPRSRDAAAEYYLDHVYPTMEQHLPPPGAVPFVAYDQGNSSPKYARLTLNNIPSTSEALSATALPLGLVLQPLAPVQGGEQPIPILDFGEPGPPRCRRCRTYINPFMTFRSGGNKFVCNMCNFPNDVSLDYFSPTDPSGARVDRAQRLELTHGTVEYLVPKEYWAKEPVGLRWLFLVDVSQEAVTKGFLEAFCQGILSALYDNDENELNGEETIEDNAKRKIPLGSKVGFVTFDKAVHFYNCNVSWKPHRVVCPTDGNIKEKLERAQMLVMPDIEDPFVPLGSEGLFVDPYDSKCVPFSNKRGFS